MKSKALGIVSEYNPFHKGHKYHIEQSLDITKADICIAVMSGNFTQRGNIAIYDKWTRSQMAVLNGVNLVIELPTVFATSNSGIFAKKSIEILEELQVDYISFGSESGNIEQLSSISKEISNKQDIIDTKTKEMIKKGLSYPKARSLVLEELFGEGVLKVINEPNNILALEYLNNIKKAIPYTIKRYGGEYKSKSIDVINPSATAIREAIKNQLLTSDILPNECYEIAKKQLPMFDECYYSFLVGKILSMTTDELDNIFGLEEGLSNSIKSIIRKTKNIEELIDGLKSKRYTRTRIQRALIAILLKIDKKLVNSNLNYARILAFDEKGSRYLKEVKKSDLCTIPIITNINKERENLYDIWPLLEKDILSSDLYNLFSQKNLYEFSDYVKKPLYLKI